MFKQIMVYVGLAMMAMANPAGSQQSPQNPTGHSLRIGASASLTGKAYSVQGNYVRDGYLLCQKHVNAQGGVLGREIEFVIYDDEFDEKTAARLYEKLITEFVYSATFWEAALPNPGNREFVAAYEKEFNRAPAVQSANSYAGCQILMEAVRQAGTTDSDKLRESVLGLKMKTVLGDFAVDERGFQVGQKAVAIQWQDGKQVVVWPDEMIPGKRGSQPHHGANANQRLQELEI